MEGDKWRKKSKNRYVRKGKYAEYEAYLSYGEWVVWITAGNMAMEMMRFAECDVRKMKAKVSDYIAKRDANRDAIRKAV